MSAAPAFPDLPGQSVAPRRRHLQVVRSEEEPAARTGSPVPGALRITRRGRLAITCTVALAVVLLVAALAGAAAPAGSDHSVRVEAGQTLSQIAATELPHLPLDRAMVEIQLANRLSSPHLQAGQTLVIP